MTNNTIIFLLLAICVFMFFNSKCNKNAQIENYEAHDSLLAGTTKYKYDFDKPCDMFNFMDPTSSGICKCMRECDGNCLEYGYTGDALCFPKKQLGVKRMVFEKNLPEKPFIGFN